MSLVPDDAALAEARSFNRKLAWLPRVKISNRMTPALIQGLLRLSQWTAPPAAAVAVECHVLPEAAHGFIRFPIRMATAARSRVHAWLRDRIKAAD